MTIAAQVIEGSSATRPADSVLRETLRACALAPEEATEISKAIFAYYRWRGFLPSHLPLPSQLSRSLELAKQFSQHPETFADEDLLKLSVPEWVGQELQVTADWVRALQAEPKLWLRARPGKVKELAALLGSSRQPAFPGLPDALEYQGREDLFRCPEFHAGQFELQDLSSQAVGVICSPAPREVWWDACAGEGGKLLHLSDLMANTGLIWASDRAEWRLTRLKRRAARARLFNYRKVLWDGGPKLPTKTRFDGVLVDAPCSGVGTWQRNPHARWTTRPVDVAELGQLQKRLLDHAAIAVKPGGKLIYSVCTLTRAETLAVAGHFEESHPGFERWDFANPFSVKAKSSHQLWLWPQETCANGMFIAAWKRSST